MSAWKTRTLAAQPFAAVLACVLGLTACGQVGHAAGTFAAMVSLVHQIQTHFPETKVAAKLVDDRELTIEITNSTKRKVSDQERTRTALEVAQFAYSRFKARDHLAKVVVSFAGPLSILSSSSGAGDRAGSFEFKGDDLARWYREQTT